MQTIGAKIINEHGDIDPSGFKYLIATSSDQIQDLDGDYKTIIQYYIEAVNSGELKEIVMGQSFSKYVLMVKQ